MDPSQMEHFSRVAASVLGIKDPTDTDEILQKVLRLGESVYEHRAKSKKVMEESGVRVHPRSGFHENRHKIEIKEEEDDEEDVGDEFGTFPFTKSVPKVVVTRPTHDENVEALDALSRLRQRSNLLTKKNRLEKAPSNRHTVSAISSQERVKRYAARIDSLKGMLES